jgi:glycosyltransferase involved in cell wall biosynthesis
VKSVEVVIVDSGMRNLGGHNYSYTRAVQAAFVARGCSVNVLANRGLPSEVAEAAGFRPVFSCGAYDFPLGHGKARDLAYLRAQSRIYAEELEHGLRTVLSRDCDLVFCHTVADFEIVGWARHLTRNPFKGALAIVLRQTPRFRSCGWLRRTLNPYWRLKPHNLGRIRSRLGRRFLLCTDSEALSEDYASVYPHRIVTLPIPLPPAVADGPSEIAQRYGLADATRLRIGYLGDARGSKGFPMLPDLVKRTLASGAPVRFVIQSTRAGSGDDHAAAPAGLEELQALATGGNVTLIPDRLSPEDYASVLHHLDVILLPYASDFYREATSGIFAEAVAHGKPVVVPDDTWMDRELAKGGGGVSFARRDAGDLAAKVLAVIRDYPEHAARAKNARGPWRAFHSAETLAGMLLAEAGLARPG